MTHGEDRLAEADFASRVAIVADLLTRAPDAPGEQARLIELVDAALSYTLAVTGTAAPEVVPQGLINTTIGDLDQLRSQLSTYIENPAIGGYSGQVTAYTEALVRNLSFWPGGGSGDLREAVTQAATQYRRSAGQQFSSLGGEIDEASAKISRLSAKVAELEADAERTSTQLQSQATRIDSLLSQMQEQFSQAQERRGSDAQTALTEFEQRTSAQLGELRDSARAALSEWQAEKDSWIESLEGEVAKAEEIVGVITASGTANAYSQEAAAQKATADWLRGLAFAIGGAAIGVGLWAVVSGREGQTQVTIARAIASLVIFGVAGYAISQSADHRRRQFKAKDREVMLAAFPVMIDGLDPEAQQKAREQLLEQLIAPEPDTKTDESVLSGSQISLVGQVFDLARRVRS